MLVVVAIVAILAALLFPVFTNAKRQAKGVDCIANLHQIGNALSMYVTANDGAYPHGGDAISTLYGHTPSYSEQLLPYTKEKEVFHCSLDTGVVMVNEFFNVFPPLNSRPSSFAEFGFSYNYVFAPRNSRHTYYESQVLYPSQTVVFYDQSGAWHSGRSKLSASLTFTQWNELIKQYQYTSLYFDGHVKRVQQTAWKEGLAASLFK